MEEKTLEMPKAEQRHVRSQRASAHIRYTKSPRPPQRQRGLKERMIFQAMVCASLLAALLMLSLFDNQLSNRVTGWLGDNLSHNMLEEFDLFSHPPDVTEPPAAHEAISRDNTRIEEGILEYIHGLYPLP